MAWMVEVCRDFRFPKGHRLIYTIIAARRGADAALFSHRF
jgi:hypothetical protein